MYKRFFENEIQFSDEVKKIAKLKGWGEWLDTDLPIETINNSLSQNPEKAKGTAKLFNNFLLMVKKDRGNMPVYSLRDLFNKYKVKPFILKKRRDFLITKFLTIVLKENNMFTNGQFLVLNKKLSSFMWDMANSLGFKIKEPSKDDEFMLDNINKRIIPNRWDKIPLQPLSIKSGSHPILFLKSNEFEDYKIKVKAEYIALFLKFFPDLTIHEIGVMKNDSLVLLSKNKMVGVVVPYTGYE